MGRRKSVQSHAEQSDRYSFEDVVVEVINDLPEDGRESIRLEPSSASMHFGLGLYIRNKYIHSGKMETLATDPDSASSAVTEEIARRLLPEYNSFPHALHLAGTPGLFQSMHAFAFELGKENSLLKSVARHYCLLEDAKRESDRIAKRLLDETVPKEEIESGAEYMKISHPDEDPLPTFLLDFNQWGEIHEPIEKAEEEFVKLVHDDMLNADKIIEMAKSNKIISENTLTEFMQASEAFASDKNRINSCFFPPAIIYLSDGTLKGTDKWMEARESFRWFLNRVRYGDMTDFIPQWVFEDKDVAKLALGIHGRLLKRLKEHSDNIEFVCIAVEADSNAIEFASERLKKNRDVLRSAMLGGKYTTVLHDDAFEDCRDDEELVELAIKTDCSNLAYASDRLKNDIRMVMLAIESSKNDGYISNFFDALSEEMQSRKDVVYAIAKAANLDSLPYEFPPEKYRDDDEVGELLADENNYADHFSLINMSRRIKEKYMTNEELERWGDRPYNFSEDKPIAPGGNGDPE